MVLYTFMFSCSVLWYLQRVADDTHQTILKSFLLSTGLAPDVVQRTSKDGCHLRRGYIDVTGKHTPPVASMYIYIYFFLKIYIYILYTSRSGTNPWSFFHLGERLEISANNFLCSFCDCCVRWCNELSTLNFQNSFHL